MKETTYKPPKWSMCVALDSDAKRCRRPAKRGVQYHGEHELYPYGEATPVWVIAYFCEGHLR